MDNMTKLAKATGQTKKELTHEFNLYFHDIKADMKRDGGKAGPRAVELARWAELKLEAMEVA